MLCCLCATTINDPAANPYWWQFLGALVLLVAAKMLWNRVRPRPRPLLRAMAGAAAFLSFSLMLLQVSIETAHTSQHLRVVLDACVFVASTLLVEVAYTLRHPRSIARALRRRASTRSTRLSCT